MEPRSTNDHHFTFARAHVNYEPGEELLVMTYPKGPLPTIEEQRLKIEENKGRGVLTTYGPDFQGLGHYVLFERHVLDPAKTDMARWTPSFDRLKDEREWCCGWGFR